MSTNQAPNPAVERDDLEESEDMLFDFFDFFDKTVDDLYAYVINRIEEEQVAEDTVADLYFSLIQRRRFFWWRKVVQISTLLLIADKKIRSMDKTRKSMKSEVFDEASLESFLGNINPVQLSEVKKAQMRTQLLQRYRESQMSSIKFVPALTTASAAVGCFMIFSSVLTNPVSVGSTSKQVAAAQVLLMDQQIEYHEKFIEAEDSLKGIAAHFAEKDLAKITLDLAPQALQIQMKQEREMGTLLRGMSKKALLSSIEESVKLAMR
ncbi:hypothetical protein HOF56_01405 [Candidatus Peribacteria bacterium]|jgi:hypothetical protein|nr:hypothetical protein [Candidatus Peribacteria bacterium]MBT4021725.1 hypothetical protein [Candidatus Peribacteria bacterium]MBT4241029.1 hypothetical protein [Candidatus Peribacteria bacterium]MBT4474473.1 hypothetical protein [Candidatus Peribacteria bacterium]